jgi:hypothetical protein
MADANRSGGGNTGIAGSDAERRAARALAERLRALGREVEIEPIRVRPSFGLTHLIHAVVGVIASVLAVYSPVAGLAILAVVTASTFGELTAASPMARLLTGSRASQNVVSDEDGGKPGLILLVAHYDAPRGGLLLERPRLRRWPAVLLWSLVVITVCAAARAIGIEATWLTVVQFVPTVALIGLCPLFADVVLSGPRPTDGGAVATVLRLTERFGGRLEHFDVMTVLTGASAHFALGMRGWLRAHRKDLDPEATAVILVADARGETPRYASKEGAVFATRLHPTLIDLCEEDAEPYVSREVSDAYVARAAGLPALRVEGTDDLLATLIRRIDEKIGPRIA